MADWRTYAKAARNTARRQAPEARDAARRASDRAGGYVRAAGRALDEGRRDDDRPRRRSEEDDERPRRRPEDEDRRDRDPAADEARGERAPSPSTQTRRTPQRKTGRPPTRTATADRPAVDTDRLVKDAAAYYTVAQRRVSGARIVPRVLRALRDALLIGISLVAIWAVLAAAGIPIPFTTVLIVVGVIVAASFGAGLYAQWKRSRDAVEATPDPGER